MSPFTRRVFNLILIITLPGLVAAKGKKCRKEPVDTDTDVVEVEPPPDPAERLQVVSVSPGQLKPGIPTPMKVYGAGFLSGAQVDFNGYHVANVTMVDDNTLSLDSPGLPLGTHDLTVINPDGSEATLRKAVDVIDDQDTSCLRLAMYFELDSSSLSSPVQSALDESMDCLQARGQIRLEGHADERGTTDYNLALGQRRAEAVQRYLLNHGIPMARLPVVSYGEERPLDTGHNEAAWARNRRVDMISN